ncbi:MAG: hypothetical protein PHX18_04820 [Candidatus Gastranaerophilales bacterium]|nr:hypothetical protein [Candidatus Gastranaerophilales bacterium]
MYQKTKKCAYCTAFLRCEICGAQTCDNTAEENYLIYQTGEKSLFYNFLEKKIYKNSLTNEFKEIDFQTAIREIDTLPDKTSDWKRLQIINIATDLGLLA